MALVGDDETNISNGKRAEGINMSNVMNVRLKGFSLLLDVGPEKEL